VGAPRAELTQVDFSRCPRHQPGFLFARKRAALMKLMRKRNIVAYDYEQLPDREVWRWTTTRGGSGSMTLIKPEELNT
jgi:hypothetical protein